jgi:hypothetical protein
MTFSSSPQGPGVVRKAGDLELLAALVVAVFLCWLWLPFARIGADVHHDGVMLKPALDVLAGQELFRDSFNQYGALTVYLHAFGLWIYPSLFTLKVMSVLATVLSLFIFYAAWRELLPVGLAIAAATLYIGFIPFFDPDWMVVPWSSDFAMLFQAIALYALLRVLSGRQALFWGVILGAMTAAVFWCRQPVGILLAVAVAVILAASIVAGWRLPKVSAARVLGAVGGGFLGLNGALLVKLWSAGAVGPWWEQNILWPKRWALGAAGNGANTWNGYWEMYLEPARFLALVAGLVVLLAPWYWLRRSESRKRWIWTGLYHAGVGLAAWFGWSVWREWFIVPRAGWAGFILVVIGVYTVRSFWGAFRSRLKEVPVLGADFFPVAALTGVSLASAAQIYPVPCPRHFFWALAPAFGLMVYALWRWTRVRPVVLALAIIFLLVPTLHDKRGWGGYTLRQELVTVTEPAVLAGLRLAPEEHEFYRDLDRVYAAVERVKPGTPVAMFGNDAMMLCMARELSNPGPYYVTWPVLIPAEEKRVRWAEILGRRPLVMVHRYQSGNLEEFVRREAYTEIWRRDAAGLVIYAPGEWAGALGEQPGEPGL